ncbi:MULTISPECIES: hypothetical protein [Olivibacter]|uniref:Uncharacterized protein n=1 Tax=Olivibacter jilunii TaxID=985016 RepID=A0ABW6AZV5_9SPHI
MANGLMIKLSVAATDNTLPKIPVVLNNGSIVLVDNNKDMVNINSLKSNVDAATSGVVQVPLVNRAADYASALGINTPTVRIDVEYNKKIELSQTTAKGGLHISVGASAGMTSAGAKISIASTIVSYLSANRTHNMFASIWGRTTRAGNVGLQYPLNLGFNANNNFITVNGGQTSSPGRGDLGVDRLGDTLTLGMFKATAAGPFNLRNAEQSDIINPWIMSWSQLMSLPGDFVAPGFIVYRLYLEDLTVSGRTYAQAKADDDALYSYAITGRLAGDTWTNPS